MSEKTVVVALGHKALGTTLPEQKTATRAAAKAIADLVEDGANVVISHSNGPQVGMIHTAMNEFGKAHPDYTFAPMSVCSAMSQGYIGYDLQNAIRAELLSRAAFINRLPLYCTRLSLILRRCFCWSWKNHRPCSECSVRRKLRKKKGNFYEQKLPDGQYRRIPLPHRSPRKLLNWKQSVLC